MSDPKEDGMDEEKQGRREGFGEGVRQGLGVLSALKEAIEETISEVRDRGDLSPEKAREAMRGALHRAQEVAGGAREKLDFVSRKEFDVVRARVDELWSRFGPEARTDGTPPSEEAPGSPGDSAGNPGSAGGEGGV